MTPKIKSALKNLQGFKFSQIQGDVEGRAKLLDRMLERQLNRLLK